MASANNTANPTQQDQASGPQLCTKDCGFFGNPVTGGMCSKCYKETVAKSAAPAPAASVAAEVKAAAPPPPAAPAPAPVVAPAVMAPPPAVVAPAAVEKASPAAAAAAASSSSPMPDVSDAPAAAAPAVGAVRPCEEAMEDEEPPKKVQVNTSRCWTCNRKIGLLGFQCKCDYYFCSEHRYSDKHACGFDFKAQGKALLDKQNPTIAPAKMEGI